jgi:methionyl-tRNA synthetase
VVPALGELTDYDKQTLDEFKNVKADVEKLLDNFRFRDAQKEAMNLARIGNKYLADTEPWKLAKTDMERVATIMHLSLQIAANLAIAFEPFSAIFFGKAEFNARFEIFRLERAGSHRSAESWRKTRHSRTAFRED